MTNFQSNELTQNKSLCDKSSGELIDELCFRHPEFFNAIREELGENYPQILGYFPQPIIEKEAGSIYVKNNSIFTRIERVMCSG